MTSIPLISDRCLSGIDTIENSHGNGAEPHDDAMSMLERVIDDSVLVLGMNHDPLVTSLEPNQRVLAVHAEELEEIYQSVPQPLNLWSQLFRHIVERPFGFILLTALGIGFCVGPLVAFGISPLLAVALGIVEFVTILGFAIPLACWLDEWEKQTQLLNLLQDLKLEHVINPQQCKELASSIEDPEMFKSKTQALLKTFQEAGVYFDQKQFEGLSQWIEDGGVKIFYEVLALHALMPSSDKTPEAARALIAQAGLPYREWDQYVYQEMKTVHKEVIIQWLDKMQFDLSSDHGVSLLDSLNSGNEILFKSAFKAVLYRVQQDLQENGAHSSGLLSINHLLLQIDDASGNVFRDVARILRPGMYYEGFNDHHQRIMEQLNHVLEADLSAIEPAELLGFATGIRKKLYDNFVFFGSALADHLPKEVLTEEGRRMLTLHFMRQWEMINDLYEKVEQKFTGENQGVHLTCGCRVAPLNEHWPLMENNILQGIARTDKERNLAEIALQESLPVESVHLDTLSAPKKPKVLIFTSRAGGGNQMVTRAIIAAIKNQYHVAVSDSNSEFEEKVWNGMARGGWWRLMSCLMKCYEPTYESALQKFEAKVKERIERDNPDIVISCCPGITIACQKVGEQKQIPVLCMPTDYDVSTYVDAMPEHMDFLTIGIPYNDDAIKAPVVPVVGAENIEVVGYPVNEAFYVRDAEEVAQLREKYHVPPNGRVMTMMMGSLGCGSSVKESADELFSSEVLLNDADQELHLFALCGSNQDLYQKLVEKYGAGERLEGSRVIVHPVSMISQAEVAEYYAISELHYTKPGGSTVTEAGLMGVPMLIDDTTLETSTLFWEKSNITFAVNRQLGEVLTDRRHFVQKVYEMLNTPRERMPLELPPFDDNLLRVLETLMQRKQHHHENY